MGEWTQVACLEPEGGPFEAELGRTLDTFRSEPGMRWNQISDDDIRVDLVYIAPAKGRCVRRVLVRTADCLGDHPGASV